MLCWSAKWKDSDEIHFASREKLSARQMLKPLHKLLEEADAVVHYNGKRFDIPWINREFILNGMLPPSPYKQIDLMETVKRQFKFPSNKLEYVTKALGVGEKVKHIGFDLWLGCIRNNRQSWELMQEYNIGDIVVLESLYHRILPWVKGHANHSLFNKGELVCPKCGSKHVQKRGFTQTISSVFQRYQCKGCGSWFKDNTRLNSKDFKTSEIM